MQFRSDALYPSRRSPVLAGNVVATSQPLAAQAGLAMLAAGGNAVDAAIAAAGVLVVVEPTGNGLGSDAFAILWDGAGLHGLNASGRSPAAWTPDRFRGRQSMPDRGWGSVTTPGAVSAWRALSDRFGRLAFEDVLAPAVDYAEHGFLLSPVIAEQWASGAAKLHDQPGFADHFMRDGEVPRAGSLVRRPALARSLRLIAETRGESFYRGELAERIADFAGATGGDLTRADLEAHAPDWCGTISQAYGGVALHEIPPNGQGIAALMALGMLRHTDLARFAPDSAEALHLEIEAMKLAFRDMWAFVGDRDHMREVNEAALLDPDYLAGRAALIRSDAAQDFGAGAPREGGTVYLTAADATGMMISFIQSNYSGFGSGVVVPETGISLQNRGFGFTLAPGHPNTVGPAKRPFHTIIPGFVTANGSPLMSFGVMGGPIQAQGHLQMLLRTQLWKQDPQTAADAPRWRAGSGNEVFVERKAGEETLAMLESKGHLVRRETAETAFGFGGAQLIHRVEGGYVAGSDPRKDGQAVGC